MLLAVAGILVMTTGDTGGGELLGYLAASAAALGYAGFSVSLRKGKDVDMMPTIALSGIVAALMSGPVAGSLAMGGRDLALTFYLGAVVMAVGLAMFTARLEAPELGGASARGDDRSGASTRLGLARARRGGHQRDTRRRRDGAGIRLEPGLRRPAGHLPLNAGLSEQAVPRPPASSSWGASRMAGSASKTIVARCAVW